MNKPTVAHLLPNYNPFPPVYPAGTELRVAEVSRRQQRYRPVVICGAFEGQPEIETFGAATIRRIKIGRAYRRLFQKITRLDPFSYTDRMWNAAQTEKASLLHVHNEPKLLSGLSGKLRDKSMPVIVHVANEKPVRPECIPLVARWIACSRYMSTWLQEKYGIPRDNINVIYTGVDVYGREPVWQTDIEYRRKLRRGFGIEDDRTVAVLFAGRLVKQKGVAELLDAFRLIRSRSGADARLLIAGNVRESNDPKNEKAVYGKEMVRRIKDLPDVKWVGSLSPYKMHEFLVAGDLFVLPSVWDDPFPTVMLEAASAGLPILGSSKGGIIEFLQDCPDILMISTPERPETWCDGLEMLINDPDLRQRTGRWLRHKVEENFDWSRVTTEIEDVYSDLLKTG